MSNPTTPFSWQMPTATDLVTDLPADFEVFGQAVATSMADLLGGTTGQVLAKTSATDMDFTWTTPQVGDITGVTAGTGISGGGTSGTVTVTNDMATTITAAGDIVVGTGSGTYDNLPIGTTAQVLTADTTVSPYKVKWATPATGQTLVGCTAYRPNSGPTQAIATGTAVILTLPNEEYDTDGFHSTVTNTSRFTIPAGKAGKYLVNAGMIYATNAGALQQMRLYVNGSVYSSFAYANGVFADQRYTADVVYGYSSIITLAVADYLEIAAFHTAAGSVNAESVRISITYLGA